jgi:hypothetical protein
MTGLLHGSARTTPRFRAERQAAQASSRAISLQPMIEWAECGWYVPPFLWANLVRTVVRNACRPLASDRDEGIELRAHELCDLGWHGNTRVAD